MKKKQFLTSLITACAIALSAFFITSCNPDAEKLPVSQRTQDDRIPDMMPKAAGGLGYLDASGAFRSIPEAHLKLFYKEILGLGDNTGLQDHSIQEMTDAETGGTVYVLQVLSSDQSLRINTRVDMYGGNYLMNLAATSLTCTCETQACASTFGCSPQIWNNQCSCTPCSEGDCKKSSTASSRAFITDFFTQLAIASL